MCPGAVSGRPSPGGGPARPRWRHPLVDTGCMAPCPLLRVRPIEEKTRCRPGLDDQHLDLSAYFVPSVSMLSLVNRSNLRLERRFDRLAVEAYLVRHGLVVGAVTSIARTGNRRTASDFSPISCARASVTASMFLSGLCGTGRRVRGDDDRRERDGDEECAEGGRRAGCVGMVTWSTSSQGYWPTPQPTTDATAAVR